MVVFFRKLLVLFPIRSDYGATLPKHHHALGPPEKKMLPEKNYFFSVMLF